MGEYLQLLYIDMIIFSSRLFSFDQHTTRFRLISFVCRSANGKLCLFDISSANNDDSNRVIDDRVVK